MQIHTLYILARLGIKEHGCSAILADEDIEHSAIDRIHYEKERIGHEYARIISEKVTQDTISFAGKRAMELKSKLFIVTPEEMERIIDAARQQMTMQILGTSITTQVK